MTTISVEDAKIKLNELIVAAIKGEKIIIEYENERILLSPQNVSFHKPKFGSAKGKIKLSEDFDQPLEDFNEYVK
mgnify:CR=1 FL=1